MSSELIVEQYKEKSIVVRGNTLPYKDYIAELGGKWNPNLEGGKGWVFPLSKKPFLEDLNKRISSGELKAKPVEKKVYEKPFRSDFEEKKFVPLKDYLDLLARVERLEQIVSHVNFVKESKYSPPGGAEISIDEDSDKEEEEKVVRLLKHKSKK